MEESISAERKKTLAQIVANYKARLAIVKTTTISLKDYLEGIKLPPEEVEFALSLWQMRDGTFIPVSGMATSHIIRALDVLRKKGFVGPKSVAFYISCPLPEGDGALDAFGEELEYMYRAPTSRFVDLFEAELEKRRLGK